MQKNLHQSFASLDHQICDRKSCRKRLTAAARVRREAAGRKPRPQRRRQWQRSYSIRCMPASSTSRGRPAGAAVGTASVYGWPGGSGTQEAASPAPPPAPPWTPSPSPGPPPLRHTMLRPASYLHPTPPRPQLHPPFYTIPGHASLQYAPPPRGPHPAPLCPTPPHRTHTYLETPGRAGLVREGALDSVLVVQKNLRPGRRGGAVWQAGRQAGTHSSRRGTGWSAHGGAGREGGRLWERCVCGRKRLAWRTEVGPSPPACHTCPRTPGTPALPPPSTPLAVTNSG